MEGVVKRRCKRGMLEVCHRFDFISYKRVFNLLWGVNQGCGLLLAGGMRERQPEALLSNPEKIECSLRDRLRLQL